MRKGGITHESFLYGISPAMEAGYQQQDNADILLPRSSSVLRGYGQHLHIGHAGQTLIRP